MNQSCDHDDTEAVTLPFTGEVVAQVCRSCYEGLPAEWGCSDCEWTEVTTWESTSPVQRVLAQPCGRHQ